MKNVNLWRERGRDMNKERKELIMDVLKNHENIPKGKGVFVGATIDVGEGAIIDGNRFEETRTIVSMDAYIINLQTEIVLTEDEYAEIAEEVKKKNYNLKNALIKGEK